MQENISHYETETGAFISVNDFNYLPDSLKEKCKPVFKNQVTIGATYTKGQGWRSNY